MTNNVGIFWLNFSVTGLLIISEVFVEKHTSHCTKVLIAFFVVFSFFLNFKIFSANSVISLVNGFVIFLISPDWSSLFSCHKDILIDLVSCLFRNELCNSVLGLSQLNTLGRLNIFLFWVSNLGILKVVLIGMCLKSDSGGRTVKLKRFLNRDVSANRKSITLAPPLLNHGKWFSFPCFC